MPVQVARRQKTLRDLCFTAHTFTIGCAEIPTGVKKTNKQHLLQRSVALMGHKELAERLRISASQLEAWIRGDATMPDGHLLRLAEILDKVARPEKE